jgi:predicted enzyme related to lactoylglutathione lyase
LLYYLQQANFQSKEITMEDLIEISQRIFWLGEADGKISKDIFEFPGGHRFHFIDPAGNELAVWSDQ